MQVKHKISKFYAAKDLLHFAAIREFYRTFDSTCASHEIAALQVSSPWENAHRQFVS